MRKIFSFAVTLVMVFLMAGAAPKFANAACVNTPSGLVSWWGGDNNALDIIGTNNGTLMNGATYAPGSVNQAFSFDGIDDYMNVPYSSSLDLQGSLTIAAWINSTSNSSQNRAIAGKAGGYQIYVEAGGLLVFGFYNGSQWTLLHSSIQIPENTWVHVAGTFNSADGTLMLYINGAPDTSLVTAQRLSANTNPLMIGGFGSNGAPFSGRIDEVAIAGRVLSSSEIAAIYNADSAGICRPSVAPPPGMIAWWSGENNANDRTGVNNGTLQGATFAPGKVGQAFSLNGTDQNVEVPNSSLWNFGSNDFSINFWVNFDGADSFFIGHDNGGFTNNKWIFYLQGGRLSFHVNGPYSVEIGQFPYTFAPGQWYHLAVTRSGSSYTIYVNGAPLGTAIENRAIPDATAPLTIGQAEGIKFVHGLMDEIAIFNRTLASDEIAAVYNAGSSGMIPVNITPDTYSFIPQTGMPISTMIVSNPVTVSGINFPTAISISGGEYSVSTDGGSTWGSWTNAAGTVSLNNQVKVRQSSSGNYGAITTATLTIGGVNGAFNVTTAASDDPNASGLVAWWKAENNAFDSVGGNNGTLQGGTTYTAGRAGQSFSFSGGSDAVNIPAFNMGTDWTIEGWLYPSGASDGMHHTFFSRSNGNLDGITINYLGPTHPAANQISAVIGNGGSSWQVLSYSGTQYPLNFWYHVAFSKSGDTYTLFINGQVKNQQTIAGVATDYQTRAINLGHWNYGVSLLGLIDEVKIFSRALSAIEIARLSGSVPDPFAFSPVTGAPLSSLTASDAITVTGTSFPTAISISGGDYRINNGAWTNSVGIVNPGDTVNVRQTSSGSYSTLTTATLTIGGVNGTFTVTTAPDITLTVTTPTSLVSQTISGTVKSGATVTVSLNGGPAQPATVIGTNWNSTVTGLHRGDNGIQVNASDSGGYAPTKSATINCTAPQLTVTVTGTGDANGMGGGTVTSVPAAIACTGGPCSALFDGLSSVTLIPTPDGDSLFSIWSGACTATSGNCDVSMPADMNAGDKNASAAFAYVLPARIQGGGSYPHIRDAYAALSGKGVILARQFLFANDLSLGRGLSILLKGGYNPAYTDNSGYSTIMGTMTVVNGSLTLEQVIVK